MIALDLISLSEMLEFFSNNEWRGFFILAMLMHFGIAVVLTAIAYFVAYILKRKRK
jgi:Na+/melibiose symporter-like transporter